MEEFLLMFHDLCASEFDLYISDKQKTSIEFDWDVIVDPFQVGQLIGENLEERYDNKN